MKSLILASNNPGKISAICAFSAPHGLHFQQLKDGPDPEETATTYRGNAALKALAFARLTDLPVVADDSGLEVDALGGAPGIYSARYAGDHDDNANNQKLLRALDGVSCRTARYRCVLALAVRAQHPWASQLPIAEKHGDILLSFYSATAEGRILTQLTGTGGFAYDPLFWSPDLGKSFGEGTAAEVFAVNHRGRALARLGAQLKDVTP
jgi:XTP/dITP diphosphohydrolase